MSKFWKITIYDTHKEYGGPEEGGWYYTAGVAERYLPKKFSSRQAAFEYCKKIKNRVDAATEKTFGRPGISNSYSMFQMRIWFNGHGPDELPIPYYC